MFLIKVTQMIQDHTAKAINSHEARRDKRMTDRLPRHPASFYAW